MVFLRQGKQWPRARETQVERVTGVDCGDCWDQAGGLLSKGAEWLTSRPHFLMVPEVAAPFCPEATPLALTVMGRGEGTCRSHQSPGQAVLQARSSGEHVREMGVGSQVP